VKASGIVRHASEWSTTGDRSRPRDATGPLQRESPSPSQSSSSRGRDARGERRGGRGRSGGARGAGRGAGAGSRAREDRYRQSPTGQEEGGRAYGQGARDASSPGGTDFNYFATCSPGMEAVLMDELLGTPALRLRAEDVEVGRSGVRLRGPPRVGYAVCMWSRVAIRVLETVARCEDLEELGEDAIYKFVREGVSDWGRIMGPGLAFSVKANIPRRTPFGPQLARVRARDAVLDSLRDAGMDRPPKPARGYVSASVPLVLSVSPRGQALLARDLAGMSLHKRGAKADGPVHKAGLNETVAAGMLRLAGWTGPGVCLGREGRLLVDPMCGGGTVLVEAAGIASGVAPGLSRTNTQLPDALSGYPFELWPDFEPKLMKGVIDDARSRADVSLDEAAQSGTCIVGNDMNERALGLARRSVASLDPRAQQLVRIGLGRRVSQFSLRSDKIGSPLHSDKHPPLVVTNPPWGLRLMPRREAFVPEVGGEECDGEEPEGGDDLDEDADKEGIQDIDDEGSADEAWLELGDWLKSAFPRGADVYCLSGNADAARRLKMKRERQYPVVVGNVDCRVLKFKLFSEAKRLEVRAQVAQEIEARQRKAQALDEGGVAGATAL